MARGDVPLQQRAGSNNAPVPGPFGVAEAKFDSRIRKVLASPFTFIERGLDEKPVVLTFALPITQGYLINRTPAPISVEIFAVDVAGRKLSVYTNTAPAGGEIAVFVGPFAVPATWILAPGEKLVLEITSGDPLAGNGFWAWPQKQYLEQRVETPRVLLAAEDAVLDPLPGRVLYPSTFPFDGSGRANFVINYSPTTPTSVVVTLETPEGDIFAETVPCPALNATPLMTVFGVGWGLSYPDKLRVHLAGPAPTDGDVVFASACLLMDLPKGV